MEHFWKKTFLKRIHKTGISKIRSLNKSTIRVIRKQVPEWNPRIGYLESGFNLIQFEYLPIPPNPHSDKTKPKMDPQI
jgi:hypothetical protein